MNNLIVKDNRARPRQPFRVRFLSKWNMLYFLQFFLLLFPGGMKAQGALQAGDRVVICGDSITEMAIYSAFIEDYLLMCQPGPKPNVFLAGLTGETAHSFATRMDFDALPLQPTVATICYGMNDGHYIAPNPKLVDLYKDALGEIVDKFKQRGVREIVVGTPGAVDTETFKTNGNGAIGATVYNQTLAGLAAAAMQVAADRGVGFAEIHEPMMQTMEKAKAKYGAAYQVSGRDGVHPGPSGALIMAYCFLKALGFDGNIGTITFDMSSHEAKASDGHKIISTKNDEIEIESSRYPFCFNINSRNQRVPSNSNEIKAIQPILEFLPFNQDLNRFVLVVNHAPSKKIKVTWGAETKEFSSEELAGGVNLAAEFLDNPFSSSFAAVHALVLQQQNFNTNCRVLLHANPSWKSMFPDSEPDIKHLEEVLNKKFDDLSSGAGAAATPVKYTIKLEPSE